MTAQLSIATDLARHDERITACEERIDYVTGKLDWIIGLGATTLLGVAGTLYTLYMQSKH